MAWIEGIEEQTFSVHSPVERVSQFFSDPARFKECFVALESAEMLDPLIWRWVLQEKSEKGITFQPDYTVIYKLGEQLLEWQTLKGNLRTEGVAHWSGLGEDQTEIFYRETIAVDLPIPRLLARVFGAIVSREIRQDVSGYLDNVRHHLAQPTQP